MLQNLFYFIERHWKAALEIGLIAVTIYYGFLYFRGTRGARVLTGLILFLLAVMFFGEMLSLPVIHALITRYAVFIMLATVVIFQPELRRAFAELGGRTSFTGRKHEKRTLDRFCDCVVELSHRKFGALIAIERDIGLRSYVETGVALDAAFSSELLQTIFHPKTALHDGGLVLREDRVLAAACIFPVSQRESLERSFGLRHRAGLGIAEETDAVAVVVSEETGSVSVCFGHRIDRGLTPVELRRRLGHILLNEGGRLRRTSATPRENRPEDEAELDTI